MKLLPISAALLLFIPLLTAADPALPGAANPAATITGVGTIINPGGDCRITGNSASMTIEIPKGDHTLDIERDSMGAPRVLQEVSGDFTAEVTISDPYPRESETVLPDHRPFHGAGLLLWVDARTYIRLERAQIQVRSESGTENIAYPVWELRLEGKALRHASTGDGRLTAPATTLRLSREGSKVRAAICEDGTNWKELDPLTLKLPEKVQIGLCASHDTADSFRVSFQHFTLRPESASVQ